jgi:hypothetical protein
MNNKIKKKQKTTNVDENPHAQLVGMKLLKPQ